MVRGTTVYGELSQDLKMGPCGSSVSGVILRAFREEVITMNWRRPKRRFLSQNNLGETTGYGAGGEEIMNSTG